MSHPFPIFLVPSSFILHDSATTTDTVHMDHVQEGNMSNNPQRIVALVAAMAATLLPFEEE